MIIEIVCISLAISILVNKIFYSIHLNKLEQMYKNSQLKLFNISLAAITELQQNSKDKDE